ncbi:MAG: hypothetical protein ACLPN2_00180 [Terriglobales bacterium]
MAEFRETKSLLDEINAVIAGYDPVLREKARDILLREAFGARKTDPAEQPGDLSDHLPQAEFRKPHLASYLGRWSPKTQADRALLCLYYLHKTFRFQSVTGHQLWEELKVHGLHVANISVAMKINVMVLRASSQVARKSQGRAVRHNYFITNTGLRYVEDRLNRDLVTS